MPQPATTHCSLTLRVESSQNTFKHQLSCVISVIEIAVIKIFEVLVLSNIWQSFRQKCEVTLIDDSVVWSTINVCWAFYIFNWIFGRGCRVHQVVDLLVHLLIIKKWKISAFGKLDEMLILFQADGMRQTSKNIWQYFLVYFHFIFQSTI